MLRFKDFIREDFYRMDHGPRPPKTFSADQDHGEDDKGNKIKGVYATGAEHAMGHAYAVPRKIPWVYHQHKDGTKNLYIDQKHRDKVETGTATISKFSKKTSNFKGLDGGSEENLSKKNETPTSQKRIASANHIRKQKIRINYVDSDELKSKAVETKTRKNQLAVAGNENMK